MHYSAMHMGLQWPRGERGWGDSSPCECRMNWRPSWRRRRAACADGARRSCAWPWSASFRTSWRTRGESRFGPSSGFEIFWGGWRAGFPISVNVIGSTCLTETLYLASRPRPKLGGSTDLLGVRLTRGGVVGPVLSGELAEGCSSHGEISRRAYGLCGRNAGSPWGRIGDESGVHPGSPRVFRLSSARAEGVSNSARLNDEHQQPRAQRSRHRSRHGSPLVRRRLDNLHART